MSTQAQYANTAKTGFAQISVANTARDGTGTLGTVYTAGPSGARLDKIDSIATVTTAAGMLRFFIAKGRPGVTISSIIFVGTTATVTTSVSHGLSTGNLVTVQAALPDDYNVTNVAITVTSSTTFNYTMSTTPTTNATSVGYYSTTPSTPSINLWREVLTSSVTPSGTVAADFHTMSSNATADIGYLPLILQPGYSLRVATNNAETWNIFAHNAGDF